MLKDSQGSNMLSFRYIFNSKFKILVSEDIKGDNVFRKDECASAYYDTSFFNDYKVNDCSEEFMFACSNTSCKYIIFFTRITWRVPLVVLELFTLPEHSTDDHGDEFHYPFKCDYCNEKRKTFIDKKKD